MSTSLADKPAMTDEKPKGARVPPPPGRLTRGIQAPIPTENQVPDNMAKPNSGFQDLNFKISPEMHRAFKTTASLRGIPMKDLLEAAFRCWQDTYGDDMTRALMPPHQD